MKLFINNHIKKENNIITDGWLAYNFLDKKNSHYYHEVHVYCPIGQFEFGKYNISHIEGVWSLLKRQIKKLYSQIPNKNFLLFLEKLK